MRATTNWAANDRGPPTACSPEAVRHREQLPWHSKLPATLPLPIRLKSFDVSDIQTTGASQPAREGDVVGSQCILQQTAAEPRPEHLILLASALLFIRVSLEPWACSGCPHLTPLHARTPVTTVTLTPLSPPAPPSSTTSTPLQGRNCAASSLPLRGWDARKEEAVQRIIPESSVLKPSCWRLQFFL